MTLADRLLELARSDERAVLFTVVEGLQPGAKLLVLLDRDGETVGDAPPSLAALAGEIRRNGIHEHEGLKVFAAGLNALDPQLLAGIELDFIGRTTATWTRERVESLLCERTRRSLRSISFATQLDQHEALARLMRPGTVAVMPSLLENSPNAVYECLEHGIPFVDLQSAFAADWHANHQRFEHVSDNH